jgi:hypothetical protein
MREKLRVMEIFWHRRGGGVERHDAERHLTQVISPKDALQLVAKVMKVSRVRSRTGSAWSCRR